MSQTNSANEMPKSSKKRWHNDKDTFCAMIKGPSFAIYLNYVLSAWGDWMWQFAAGLYLVYLADNVLRLAAIFGFTGGTLMLVFGGIIGDWVDRNGRMKVVSISLFVQNISVALCATSVCFVTKYRLQIYGDTNGYLVPLVEGIIISLALVAYISSMAYKIAIEKDWIVVVASGNRGALTNLNAVTRAIDLSCKILAPTIAGIIMSYSHLVAAIFIAIWNFVSVFCEYALLRRVYNLVPALAVKGVNKEDKEMKELKDIAEHEEKQPMNKDFMVDGTDDEPPPYEQINSEEKIALNNTKELDKTSTGLESAENVKKKKKKKSCWQLAVSPFLVLAKGWKTYARQKIVFAGLALAFLYMTVLGFDCVTTGYIYTNGIKETYVGISMAAAGLTGIIGTFIFSRLNRHLGLERTGLIAFSSEILCLTLTVVSIWAPGTIFDPTFSNFTPNCTSILLSNSTAIANQDLVDLENILPAEEQSQDNINERYKRDADFGIKTDWLDNIDLKSDYGMLTYGFDGLQNEIPMSWSMTPALSRHQYLLRSKRNIGLNSSSLVHTAPQTFSPVGGPDGGHSPGSYHGNKEDCDIAERPTTSIILFLVGIILSRIGLWMADLVVTQLLQENVLEMERGIVNGVQNSLNMLMDMVKFALVIALPKIETYGILILLSFLFICIAGCFFILHVWKVDKPVLQCKGKSTEAKIEESQINVDEKNSTEVV